MLTEQQQPIMTSFNDPLAIRFMTGDQMGYMPQAQFLTPQSYGAFRTLPAGQSNAFVPQEPGIYSGAIIRSYGGIPGILPKYTFNVYNPAVNQQQYMSQIRRMHSDRIAEMALAVPDFLSFGMLRSSEALRDIRGIQNMTMSRIVSGPNVNPATGMGFNAASAQALDRTIRMSAAGDALFKEGDYRKMLQLGIEHGMFDYANNAQQYKDVLKKLRNSMTTMMEVLGSTDFKDIMQDLQRLQTMGAGLSQVRNIARMEGMYSRITGLSHADLVNTYGQQGAFIFSQMGLNGYQGSLAAMSNAATITMGQRLGLISPAQLARHGGASGYAQQMTQEDASMQAQMKDLLMGYLMNDSASGLDPKADLSSLMRMKNPLQAMAQRAGRFNTKERMLAFLRNRDELFGRAMDINNPEVTQAMMAMMYGQAFGYSGRMALEAGFRGFGMSAESASLRAARFGSREFLDDLRRDSLLQRMKRQAEWETENSPLRRRLLDIGRFIERTWDASVGEGLRAYNRGVERSDAAANGYGIFGQNVDPQSQEAQNGILRIAYGDNPYAQPSPGAESVLDPSKTQYNIQGVPNVRNLHKNIGIRLNNPGNITITEGQYNTEGFKERHGIVAMHSAKSGHVYPVFQRPEYGLAMALSRFEYYQSNPGGRWRRHLLENMNSYKPEHGKSKNPRQYMYLDGKLGYSFDKNTGKWSWSGDDNSRIMTPIELASIYAPPFENKTASYAMELAQALGLPDVYSSVDFSKLDDAALIRFTKAVVQRETSQSKAYTEEQYEAGLRIKRSNVAIKPETLNSFDDPERRAAARADSRQGSQEERNYLALYEAVAAGLAKDEEAKRKLHRAYALQNIVKQTEDQNAVASAEMAVKAALFQDVGPTEYATLLKSVAVEDIKQLLLNGNANPIVENISKTLNWNKDKADYLTQQLQNNPLLQSQLAVAVARRFDDDGKNQLRDIGAEQQRAWGASIAGALDEASQRYAFYVRAAMGDSTALDVVKKLEENPNAPVSGVHGVDSGAFAGARRFLEGLWGTIFGENQVPNDLAEQVYGLATKDGARMGSLPDIVPLLALWGSSYSGINKKNLLNIAHKILGKQGKSEQEASELIAKYGSGANLADLVANVYGIKVGSEEEKIVEAFTQNVSKAITNNTDLAGRLSVFYGAYEKKAYLPFEENLLKMAFYAAQAKKMDMAARYGVTPEDLNDPKKITELLGREDVSPEDKDLLRNVDKASGVRRLFPFINGLHQVNFKQGTVQGDVGSEAEKSTTSGATAAQVQSMSQLFGFNEPSGNASMQEAFANLSKAFGEGGAMTTVLQKLDTTVGKLEGPITKLAAKLP